jgi:ribonuclease-3
MTPRIAELQGGGERHKWKDPRSRLQELTQRDGGHTPIYEVVERSGPAHAPEFTVAALVDGDELGRGCGGSKRAAARSAAEDALSAIERGL